MVRLANDGLSFVIPTLNEEAALGHLLCALRSQFPSAELIVVDGGSADNSAAIASKYCDKLLQSEPGRARQMNLGAEVASGRYIFFLHADTCPEIDEAGLATYLARAPSWGFSRVRLSGDQWYFRLISQFMNWRSTVTQVATGDQMLYITRDLLNTTGGFDEIPLMEDVALSKRLRRICRPCVIQQPVVTSSRRWREQGVVRTVVKMWLLRLAYFIGVSPRYLHRSYYGG